MTLILLSKNIAYSTEVEDIWFKASKKRNISAETTDFYFPDESFTALGCVELYQFCNAENCTPLGGIQQYLGFDSRIALDSQNTREIAFSEQQLAVGTLMLTYLTFMRLGLVIDFLRHDVLLAKQYVYGSARVSSSLESGQWRTEMENLHNISLAGLQAHGVLHAAPGNAALKPGVSLHDYIVPETNYEQLRLCNNQIFRSTEYSSFSLLGLLVVCIVSGLLIVFNFTIPPLVQWVQRKWRIPRLQEARNAWIEDDVLQLQRAMLEGKGLGPWRGKDEAVPVMDGYGEVFSRRDFGDEVLRMQSGGGGASVPLTYGHEASEMMKNPSVEYTSVHHRS